MRRIIIALILMTTGSAAADPPPLWRRDVTHLPADRALLRECLSSATVENACAGAVQTACANAIGYDSNATLRLCGWRAIAAWEDEMADTLDRLKRAGVDSAALDAAQAQWQAVMIADVRLIAAPFEGGSMQGPVAAQQRALMVASRTIWLRHLEGFYVQE